MTGAALGAPLMTTRGGAGDVLSDTGDRRGVMGAPPPAPAPGVGLVPSVLPAPLFVGFNGDPPLVRSIGEATAGDDGPGAEFDVVRPGFVGALGDLDLESLFVRGKFWVSGQHRSTGVGPGCGEAGGGLADRSS